MKKNIFPLLILSLIFCSCQKEDNNGDFGGMWRLTEIVKSDGSITDTKEKSYFWKVQLELIKIGSQFGRFQNTGDSLFIQMIDPKCPSLKKYGIYNNSNEKFKILHLDRNGMRLQSDSVRLRFRKF